MLTTSCCNPQPGCEHCKRSRRIRETYQGQQVRYVHLKDGGGFVDCAIQDEGQRYDHRNKGVSRG